MIRSSTILVTALLMVVFIGHAYTPGVAHADDPAEGPEVYAEDEAEAQMMLRWTPEVDTRDRQDLQEHTIDCRRLKAR